MQLKGPLGTPETPVLEAHAEDTGRPFDPRTELIAALIGIRDDLGFETVTLFAPGPGGWKLLERQGPRRAWHAVLDPSALEGTPEAAQYTDARAIPGIGPRLAALGCASVASLPLPDGCRLILDARTASSQRGWVERARPYLSLISIMSGPRWPAGDGAGTLRGHVEVASLQRLFSASQSILERPESSVEELLESVRDAIRADELFLITRRGTVLEVLASPARPVAGRLTETAQVLIPGPSGMGLNEEVLRQLAVSLGASSRALAGGYGLDDTDVEIALAGWATGPALSPVSMTVVARTLSTIRSALRTRRSAVTELVGRERDRMAFALHDGLTQTVTGAVLELEALARRIERDPREAVETLDGSKREIRRALAELRAMLMDLSEDGQQSPRSAELLWREVDDVVRRWRLPARIKVEGDLDHVPGRILSATYVVIREALTNAAKYAPGTNVTVVLAAGPTDLTVTVGDEGTGFTRADELSARESQHVGLEWLRRRVREAGGRLYVHPRPGKGTRVIARFPLREAAS
jgi:signal transduction histidine kinase